MKLEPASTPKPQVKVASWRTSGEDLILTLEDGTPVRHNVRRLFSEAIGYSLNDSELADLLHAMRASLVPPGELQRAMDEVTRAVAKLGTVVADTTARRGGT